MAPQGTFYTKVNSQNKYNGTARFLYDFTNVKNGFLPYQKPGSRIAGTESFGSGNVKSSKPHV